MLINLPFKVNNLEFEEAVKDFSRPFYLVRKIYDKAYSYIVSDNINVEEVGEPWYCLHFKPLLFLPLFMVKLNHYRFGGSDTISVAALFGREKQMAKKLCKELQKVIERR